MTPRVILVPDGMADEPLPELDGRTPLEAAHTPNMDALAAAGIMGSVRTVPRGMAAGSDVANLSVLGYDARALFTGRAPLEAASMGVRLAPDDVAYRCNFVTIAGGIMKDNTASGIGGAEACTLIGALTERFSGEPFEFHCGVGYRHLMVWRGGAEAVCTPPHDILDRPAADHLPIDAGTDPPAATPGGPADKLRAVMAAAHDVVAPLRPSTDIWLWGEGRAPRLPPLRELRGLRGAVVSAVDLVRGIGMLAGMDLLDVPGATGDLETDYAAKGRAAVAALDDHDLVFVHVEAPDEAGHQGDAAAKILAIQRIDAEVLGPLLAAPRQPAVLVVPDHFTPVRLRTHSDPPVPFAFARGGAVGTVRTTVVSGTPGIVAPATGAAGAVGTVAPPTVATGAVGTAAPPTVATGAPGFCERTAAATAFAIESGPELMDLFLARTE